jgi:putative hydrolase of the HAD superfamily
VRFTTLFLDAVGTLFGLRQSPGATYAAFARRHGMALDAEKVSQAFGHQWRTLGPPQYPAAAAENPEARETIDRQWWRQLVRHCFTEAASEGAEVDLESHFERCFDDLFAHYGTAEPWIVYPETAPVLSQWREEGRQLVVLSNFDRRLRDVMDRLGLTQAVDLICYSSALGASKPSPLAFKRALAQSGATAERTLHIGDDEEKDAHGARAAGLRCFHLQRPDEDLQDAAKHLRTLESAAL